MEIFFILLTSPLCLVMKWEASSKCIYESKYVTVYFYPVFFLMAIQEEPLIPFSKYETFVEFRKLSVASQAGGEIEDDKERFQLYNDYLLKYILRYNLNFVDYALIFLLIFKYSFPAELISIFYTLFPFLSLVTQHSEMNKMVLIISSLSELCCGIYL